MYIRNLKFIVIVMLASFCFALSSNNSAQTRSIPRVPVELFSPSNARTENGKLISETEFFPAARCVSCHKDTHAGWSQSLHRNAGREPFYKESVDLLVRTRGIEFSRHCESCHAPISLFSGALTTGSKVSRAMDDEGVTCSVCHAITETRLEGTGSYTIRRPALIAREDGTPVFGDMTDEQIQADIPGHRRAMMRPLLKQPEFCAACHKSVAPPALNGYKFLRGFSAYDEWQQSSASHETVAPFYKRNERTDCRACHMPAIESLNDRAAKKGLIASHRWLGANSTVPLFYGHSQQATLTEKFLQANVLNIDIFALRKATTGNLTAPLSTNADNYLEAIPGEEVTAEVVIANRNAAHSFPPELRDMYEPWVEFEVLDAAGKTIFHSGFVKPDQTLDESAHVYKQILLDESARAITRHQVWLSAIKAYDNTIPPGRSDVVRYRFRIPEGAKPGDSTIFTLRARLNYRRFIQEYSDYVSARQKTSLPAPIVQMTSAEVKIAIREAGTAADRGNGKARLVSMMNLQPGTPPPEARRWNDYGIALLEQAQYGAAAEAFCQASLLDPTNPTLLTSAAIAEMKTERFGPEREQWRKAMVLLDAALKIAPLNARTLYFRAIVLRGESKTEEAAAELAKLANQYPRDREIQRQLGQTYFRIGRLQESRLAFEAVLAIDPTDAGAYQFLASLYAVEDRKADAERANSLYLLWRDDPLTDGIAGRFYLAHPEWADERIGTHIHSIDSPRRPTLTGALAAPDK